MKKDFQKRLALLELAAQEKQRQKEETSKIMYIKLVNNVAHIAGRNKLTLTAESPFEVVEAIETHIRETQPESINMSVELSGVADLIVEFAEIEAGRLIDRHFVVFGNATGHYFQLLQNNENITLANILLCETLLPYFRETRADSEMGVEHFFQDSALCLAHDESLITYLLCERVRAWQAHGVPPKNRWSKFWQEITAQ